MVEDGDVEIELLDYEEEEIEILVEILVVNEKGKKDVKGIYVSIYSFGFWDFLLKLEFLCVIVDCGFEYFFEGKYVNEINLIVCFYFWYF